MVTDTAAAESMAERVRAVQWDGDAAFAHRNSRAQLALEFLRRTAQWAVTLGAQAGWPASDLAGALAPELTVAPELLTGLDPDETSGMYPVPPGLGAAMVRWAALGDLPRQRFPQLDDPYEPLLEFFARGGAYKHAPGELDLGFSSVQLGTVAARAALEPLPIDAASLDALDRVS